MMSCICDDDKSMCFRCCKKPGGACQVTGGALPTGRPCNYGTCVVGVCEKGKPGNIRRFFSFIEKLDSSTLVAFMKSNIVGTIIVFSLLVWVPASWTVSCIDKRNERKSHMLTNLEEPVRFKESSARRAHNFEESGRYNPGRRPLDPPPTYRRDYEHLPPILREEDIYLLNDSNGPAQKESVL
ncbi:disintegrin and metalloproteinase domain-containing protein 17 [Aplysia californica]|uniref:Disintegrin and metalloproteinase domain-containing protein 17 n=1 Tax=Aplysia californica TaxID=6500 RepID=A0ABM1ACN0_APLCA|nr:disintegrin and metalloproteinase domain-containing protein 17 [Aplysia californica]